MTWVVLAFLVAVQTATGAVWWSWMRRRASLIEVLGMGLALGSAVSLLAGLAGLLLPIEPHVRPWLTLVPAVITGMWWLIRQRSLPRHSSARAEWVAVAIGLVSGGGALIVNISHYPLNWSGTTSSFHPDMLFFEALANGMPTAGPSDSILMAGADLRYHWFTYAWAGQLTTLADAPAFVALTRVLPVVALLGLTLVGAAWAWRATKIAWAPTLAVLLLVTGGYVGATYGTILNFDSPSQSLSALWLLSWFLVALLWMRKPSWAAGALVVALSFALTGGKVSAGVVAAGATLVLLLGSLLRPGALPRARSAMLAALTCIPAGVAYALLLAGSAEQGGLKLFAVLDRASSVQGLNPVNTPRGIAVGTAILLLAMLPRWAGLAWLCGSRTTRWRPETVLGAGFLLASIGTVLVVSGGLNDTWFALSASAPLAVLSAIGVAKAVDRVCGRRGSVPRLVWLGLLTGVTISVVVTLIWATGPSPQHVRWLGPILGLLLAAVGAVLLARMPNLQASFTRRWVACVVLILVMMAVPTRLLGIAANTFGPSGESALGSDTFTPFVPFVPSLDQSLVTTMTNDQLAAGAWLHDHLSSDDLVATNVTFSPAVAALSGASTWISGIKYQAPYGRLGDVPELLVREVKTFEFVSQPSASTLAPLCSAGVRWVWIDPARTTTTTDWEPFGHIEQSGDGVNLLSLACG